MYLSVCVCVNTDYVSGGEMFTHLYQRDHFPEEAVRIYIGEIILALEHLHKVGVAPSSQLCNFKLQLSILARSVAEQRPGNLYSYTSPTYHVYILLWLTCWHAVALISQRHKATL